MVTARAPPGLASQPKQASERKPLIPTIAKTGGGDDDFGDGLHGWAPLVEVKQVDHYQIVPRSKQLLKEVQQKREVWQVLNGQLGGSQSPHLMQIVRARHNLAALNRYADEGVTAPGFDQLPTHYERLILHPQRAGPAITDIFRAQLRDPRPASNHATAPQPGAQHTRHRAHRSPVRRPPTSDPLPYTAPQLARIRLGPAHRRCSVEARLRRPPIRTHWPVRIPCGA